MKTTNFLFFILLFISQFAFSQNVKISFELGEIQNKNMNIDEFFANDSTGFYALKYDNGYSIVKYDLSLKVIKSIILPLKYNGKRTDFKYIINLNSKVYIISSLIDKNQNIVLCQSLNLKTFKFAPELKAIIKIPNELYNNVNYKYSPDNKKVLLYYKIITDKENTKYGLTSFDENFKQIQNTNVNILKDIFVDYDINNNGNIYYKTYLRENKKLRNVFYLIKNDNSIKEIPVFNSTDINYLGLNFRLLDNDKMYVYKINKKESEEKLSINTLGGIYSFVVDLNSYEVTNRRAVEFSYETIIQDNYQKHLQVLNNKTDTYYLKFQNVFCRKDGGKFLLFEQSYGKDISSNIIDESKAQFHVVRDIVVVSLSENGDYQWLKRIPKQHYYKYEIHTSYAPFFRNDKLYLFFNDNSKNTSESDKIYAFNGDYAESCISCVEVDSKGNIQKHILLNYDQTKVFLINRYYYTISENSILMQASSKNDFEFPRARTIRFNFK